MDGFAQAQKGEPMSDLIDRYAAIDEPLNELDRYKEGDDHDD